MDKANKFLKAVLGDGYDETIEEFSDEVLADADLDDRTKEMIITAIEMFKVEEGLTLDDCITAVKIENKVNCNGAKVTKTVIGVLQALDIFGQIEGKDLSLGVGMDFDKENNDFLEVIITIDDEEYREKVGVQSDDKDMNTQLIIKAYKTIMKEHI